MEGIDPATLRAVLVACVTLLFSLHLCRWLRLRSGSGPPGPFAWPLIGNAAQLGGAPHEYFTSLAEKYGSVFQIRLGSRAVVVLNGDSIKQALVKQGPQFAGRPDFTSFRFISGGSSFAFGTISGQWKAQRRAAHAAVHMFSTGNPHTKKMFEQHVVSEVREVLRLFVGKTQAGGPFQPMAYLVVSTANIMSALCFGKRYSYEDEEFRQVVGRNDQFTRTVGAGSIVDVMPWLQYFPNPIKTIFDNFKRLNREFDLFIRSKVTEHRSSIRSSLIRDVTDALIVALEPRQGKDYVVSAVEDIFGASQDTLSTALHWIFLILVKFPEMQARLQQEVDKVVDRSRIPSVDDQPRLPFVMAFIYEVMRFTSFVPLTIPHATVAETTIQGYTIPKDTVVFINQWSVNHDPRLWARPDTFDPERFLDGDGALDKDLAGGVLIFSMGKRRCIGEELSKLHLFLFTALLVHQCHLAADPARPPQLDYHYGLTLKPRAFSVAVRLRDNMMQLDAAVAQAAASGRDGDTHQDT